MTEPVRFDNVSLTYPGATEPAVSDLNLEVERGELLVLVGPSGCGKTSTLRMLAGLEKVSAGRIFIGSKDVTDLEPKDRDLAMVFQNFALYPHMTVAENMAFALKIQKTSKAEIDRRVKTAAEMLELTDFLGRKPKALSGGQRQRVAMGRAIVREPSVFLMDEPLSNLDAKLRSETRSNISQLQRRLGTTTVYVTHDQVEAMTMGDRVAVLKDGILQQIDTPRNIYDNPANAFVASFFGSPSMNLFAGRIVDGGVEIDELTLPISREILAHSESDQVLVGARPEDLHLSDNGIKVEVTLIEELGAETLIHAVTCQSQNNLVIRSRGFGTPRVRDLVYVAPGKHILFSATGAQVRLS